MLWTNIIILSAALLGAALLITGILLLNRYLRYRSGRLAHAITAGALKKYGIIRNYKVLENLHIRCGNRDALIDCALIGFFGILLVSTVNDTAEYYGDVKGPQWTKVSKTKREKMENLCEKNLHDIDVIREIFAKNSVYGIQMEGIVVFCGNPKKSLVGITGAQGLMSFKKFKSYLGKSKFEKDNDVDVPLLTGLILQHKV